MLQLERVSKIYRVGLFGRDELHAVRDVSFEVHSGEVVALIGESGSGKTTIGRMVLRLTPITSGRILFEGQDVSTLRGTALKAYYRHVQGVFQDPFSSFNPIFKADRVFRVIRNEFFPHVPRSEWQGRVEEALRSVGLLPDQVLNKYPHQLSGGQLQRFLIARALLLQVKFLVADEITSMLDASTRMDVLNLLVEFKQQGLAVLFITHDLSLGYYLSDRVVILYRGVMVETGPTDRLFAQPRHPYTQMLLDAVPRLDRKWNETHETPQTVRQLNHTVHTSLPATACPFVDRCPVAGTRCWRVFPQLVQVAEDHMVACHLYTSEGVGEHTEHSSPV